MEYTALETREGSERDSLDSGTNFALGESHDRGRARMCMVTIAPWVNSTCRGRARMCMVTIAPWMIIIFILVVKMCGSVQEKSLASQNSSTCRLYQDGGLNLGGYGDRIRNSYRSAILAQILGCQVVRQSRPTEHGYDNCDIVQTTSDTRLVGSVCNTRELFNISRLHDIKSDCDIGYYTVWKSCDLWIYDDTYRWDVDGLRCVGNAGAYVNLTIPPLAMNRGMIHYRRGDLAGADVAFDKRIMSEDQLYIIADLMIKVYYVETVVVATQGPLSVRKGYEWIVVESDGDPKTVMGKLAASRVVGISASGFVIAPMMLFRGDVVITPEKSKADVIQMLSKASEGVVVVPI